MLTLLIGGLIVLIFLPDGPANDVKKSNKKDGKNELANDAENSRDRNDRHGGRESHPSSQNSRHTVMPAKIGESCGLPPAVEIPQADLSGETNVVSPTEKISKSEQ